MTRQQKGKSKLFKVVGDVSSTKTVLQLLDEIGTLANTCRGTDTVENDMCTIMHLAADVILKSKSK